MFDLNLFSESESQMHSILRSIDLGINILR